MGIEAGDPEVYFVLVVENTDLGLFSRGLSFKGFSLQKVGNWSGLQPEWIIDRAIQPRRSINTACLSTSKWFLRPSLGSFVCGPVCTWELTP
jgi:hypothetical protein